MPETKADVIARLQAKNANKEAFYAMVEKAGPLPSSGMATTGLEKVRNQREASDVSAPEAGSVGQTCAPSSGLRPRMPGEANPSQEWDDDNEPNFMGAGLFIRELCPTCSSKSAVACFKVKDSRICLYCLHSVRKVCKKDIEGLHELTLAQVKEFMAKAVDKPEEAVIVDTNEDDLRTKTETEEV